MFSLPPGDDYFRNKADPDAIVEPDDKGNPQRFCEDVFDSPQQFREIKDWSDKSFHDIYLSDRYYQEHTVPLEQYEYMLSTESQKETEAQSEYRHRQYLKLDKQLHDILSKKQYRRFKMHCEDRLSEREIADIEGVSQTAVSYTLQLAWQQIKNFFGNL